MTDTPWLTTIVLLSACSGVTHVPDTPQEQWLAASDDWAALTELAVQRFDVPDGHMCFAAFDNVEFFVGSAEELSEDGCSTACTLMSFPKGVPEGVYTIAFDERLTTMWYCLVLGEELIHVLDGCLKRNWMFWPYVEEHDPELYDASGGEYPLELELRAITYEGCMEGR